ncbi:hypothetical protein SAMN02910358_00574 [Lachnospiraceae bacterium XBB1006]|nr:hypothetical protein SAMN02910358_00574 [Lachnospiraceae bacterium XBB1006]
MRMSNEKNYVVDGYVFETQRQAEQARREVEGIKYTKETLNMNEPEAVLNVYNRILRDKIFTTPIGYAFLRELQEYLIASPAIVNSEIHPIDFSPVVEQVKWDDKESMRINKKRSVENYKAGQRELRQKQRLRKQEETARGVAQYRKKFRLSLVMNLLLVMAIAAMFLMVHFSDVPTIVDYENKLIDRYEEWDRQLTEREQKIEEYEEKYHIINGYEQP